MKVKILFFGFLKDVVNMNKLSVESDSFSDTESVKKYLTEKYPELERFNYLMAVNQQVEKEKAEINEGDEIALLPPFSGG